MSDNNNDDNLNARIDNILQQLENESETQPPPVKEPQPLVQPVYIQQPTPQKIDYSAFRKDTSKYQNLYEQITQEANRKKALEEKKLKEFETKSISNNYGLYSFIVLGISIIGYGIKLGIESVKELNKNKVNF